MIKLKVDSKRNLSFIERDRILQGEHKFDTLQISLPEKIDSNDEYVSGMLIKIFFVHDKDRVTRQVIPDQDLNVETVIDYTLTEKARRWLVYVCFYKVGDEDIEVGKTNPVAVSVNHIPYNEALDIKSKDPDILLFKGDKGDKGDPGKDGVDGKDGKDGIDGKDGKDGEQGPPGEKGDKGDPGKDGKDGEQGPPGETIRDYTELENKPSINNVTLQGNKTSNELGLQKKLTAGTNISIGNDGTISASGGTNDYQELENLPVVEGNAGSPRYSLTYGLNFNSAQFNISKIANDLIQVRLWNVTREIIDRGWAYFVGGEIQDLPEFHYRGIYDFNQLTITVEGETVNYKKAGYWIMQGINCRNIPQAFSDLVSDSTLLIVSHFAGYPIYEENKLFLYRTVYLLDSQNRVRIFSQYCKTFLHEAERVQNISDWQELNAGGSQIVSGVVNQNGTITFTDTDGQTFTTSGSSVIGADGQDYVLTSQDKTDIANIVLGELPTTQGVLYGNTSN